MRLILLALAATSCSFSGGSIAGDPDASATPDAAEPILCDPSWEPAGFDPCSLEVGPPLSITSDALYDTTALTLTVGDMTTELGGILTLEPNVAFIYAASVTVEEGATLRVVGDLPLLVASAGDLTIAGSISIGGVMELEGAGANPDDCLVAPPTSGENDNGGAGGGGGGAFAAVGGNGNDGDDDSVNGGDGGDGGAAIPMPATPSGGCPGERGGDGGSGEVGGVGGGGGGALQLSARGSLIVASTGAIDAGGGGGRGGSGDDAGGGGGGAGGYIRLDAVSLRFENGASITANGGSGGGGAGGGSDPAGDGDDGSRTTAPVQGGFGGSTFGEGGEGGARSTGNSGKTPPGDPNGGGGGGGGSAGFIIVDRALNPSAGVVISPTPTPIKDL